MHTIIRTTCLSWCGRVADITRCTPRQADTCTKYKEIHLYWYWVPSSSMIIQKITIITIYYNVDNKTCTTEQKEPLLACRPRHNDTWRFNHSDSVGPPAFWSATLTTRIIGFPNSTNIQLHCWIFGSPLRHQPLSKCCCHHSDFNFVLPDSVSDSFMQ